MQLTNVRGFRNINEYVRWKIDEYRKTDKDLKTLFGFMFSERENIMAEISDGYRIKKVTYGEFSDKIYKIAPAISEALSGVEHGSTVGIYMNNSMEWIQVFWSVLMCGYNPLLMNLRIDDDIIESIINEYSVKAVISDEKTFSCKTLIAEELISRESSFEINAPWGTEVIFMSSGTTESIKLCVYTGENFFYQICNSVSIIESCPEIKEHYEGELKHLTLLPFYHVFGFIAVYLWFGFFSRTFVFLKDMNPMTILNTVRKHKVTHVFAVPLVWDTVYKEAIRKIKERGDKTYSKFKKGIKISNSLGNLGNRFASSAFSEVRENIFGDSIRFLISGGSSISRRVLEFFNGIGYHLANGYGMTEIGITSVEISSSKKILNTASIGAPFVQTKYSVSDKGELLVSGRTMASKIIQGNNVIVTDFDKWFNTKDLVTVKDGRYYIDGRIDDLIVCENGENINPVLSERKLRAAGFDSVCLFADNYNVPTLIVSIPPCFSSEKLRETMDSLSLAVRHANLEGVIKKIVLTHDPLIEGAEFKVSRRRVASKYSKGLFKTINPESFEGHFREMLSELEREVRECFAIALEKAPDDIDPDATFFLDLGGSSLDYFTLLNLLKSRYNISLPSNENERLYTVRDFCNFIMQN